MNFIHFIQCANPEVHDTQMFGVHYMPVWIYTLAAHLKDQEIGMTDLRIESERKIPQANYYFLTGINQDLPAILSTLERLRERFPKAAFAIGGPVTWSLKTSKQLDLLDKFDLVFVGDGEILVAEFLMDTPETRISKRIYQTEKRFDLSQSLPMETRLLSKSIKHYYGGVVEVARGCPFLCEFCDIRVQPDNNRTHVKPVSIILEDVENLVRLGATQILFACDNLIGNAAWATELASALIAWKKQTGFSPSFYTWLTIDLARRPDLLRLLRLAGFEMFFIGVESFNPSSLLETAKLQNTTLDLSQAISKIQSYGFIVVAGLIMGFDTDTDDATDIALKGILCSGLLSGDPSLLTALPGTPLHHRLKLSGRLRDAKANLGGKKYHTNIRYIKPANKMIGDYLRFISVFNSGEFQLARYRRFLGLLNSDCYIKSQGHGYVSTWRALWLAFSKPKSAFSAIKRLSLLLFYPRRLSVAARAWWMTLSLSIFDQRKTKVDAWGYFKFWLFNWSNSLTKYSTLKEGDFNIESVAYPMPLTGRKLIPEGYLQAFEPIPISKIMMQRQATIKALTTQY